MLDLISIKIQKKDLERLEKLRVHKTQPRWSIVEDLLDKVEKRENIKNKK